MANVIVSPEEITKKVNEVIAEYVDTSAINLNKLIDGSSVNRPNASNAIAIQDLSRDESDSMSPFASGRVSCFIIITHIR